MLQPYTSLLEQPDAIVTEMLEKTSVLSDGAPEPITFGTIPALPRGYRIAKRVLDVSVSGLLLLILSPVLAAAALAIKLTSPGPILFRQQRVGTCGRIFTMYKFRSMDFRSTDTAHKAAYARFVSGKGGNGKVTKAALEGTGLEIEDQAPAIVPATEPQRGLIRGFLHRMRPLLHAEDTRITPVGAILRLSSIDELPQLFNVLKGDMSMVGPRPPIPYEVRMYRHRYLVRLAAQPGVTGIWQVFGRNKVPFDQMVDMDIDYIRRRSFWMDVKLILLTVPAVLTSRSPK